MTASRDPDRLIRAFLEEGIAELPDRAFDTVRAGIERTHQRAAIGPWRTFRMTSLFRLAGATALVAVLVAGVTLVARPALFAGSSPSPGSAAPTTSIPTTNATAPARDHLAYTWPSALAPGTYATSFVWHVPFAIRFTVPNGWASRDIEVMKGSEPEPELSVSFQLVDNTYTGACTGISTVPPAGPSVDELARAIAGISGIATTTPVAASLAGQAGMYLQYDAPGSGGCGSSAKLWRLAESEILPVGPVGGVEWPLRAGAHRVWIVVYDDVRIVIDAGMAPGATSADESELQAVIDSIEFGPPVEARSIGSCAFQLIDVGTGKQLTEPPYQVRMGGVRHALRGPIPVDGQGNPLTPAPPLAQVDFIAGSFPAPAGGTPLPEGWHPGAGMTPPKDSPTSGFQTNMTVNGYQGSWVFDSPGTWWAQIEGLEAGCYRQFPVEVLPPAG